MCSHGGNLAEAINPGYHWDHQTVGEPLPLGSALLEGPTARRLRWSEDTGTNTEALPRPLVQPGRGVQTCQPWPRGLGAVNLGKDEGAAWSQEWGPVPSDTTADDIKLFYEV